MSEKRPSGLKKPPNDFYKYTGMAIKMGVVISAGVFGGQKLDEYSNNESPWYTILLSLFSVAIAIYIVISDTKR
jgi:membrane protein DedA with SNARE-associated domain